MTWTTCAVVSTLTTLLVCPAMPARAAGTHWGEIAVPGGVAAARRVLKLGESKGRFDASLVVDFTYRHARTGDWPRAAETLRRYLASVDAIRHVIGDSPKDVGPPAANAPRAETDRFRRLCEALGIERRRVSGEWRYAPGTSDASHARAEWADALGFDVDAIAAAWSEGREEAFSLTTGAVPVPLPGFWAAGAKTGLTLDDLLSDRRAGLFYTALMALDEPTLDWFDAHRDVLRRVRDQSAPAFSAFARSLRIDNGVVVMSGDARMTPAWTRLIGRSAADPATFIPALLTTDDGLLAYFFDAVRHASSSVQEAMSERIAQRAGAIDDMYRSFRDGAGTWSVEARPFDRPAHDPAWALSLLELPGGRVGAPAWLPAVLARAAGDNNWPQRAAALPSRMPVGDVGWAIRWLFERPDDQVERVKLLRFAQRIDRLEEASPDAAEAALRTFWDVPVIALALERMGIHDAETIGRVGRAGYTLSRAADRRTIEPILARWQSSFALVEQAARLRRLPARVTTPLVLALADAAMRPPREVTDRILHWTTGTLLPVLAPGPDAESMARILSDSSMQDKVIWEGLTYDRSPLRVARRDLDALTMPPAAAGEIVQPIVYAMAMTPLHQTPSLLRDAWTFHALSTPESRDDWWRRAWQPATQEQRIGGGSGLVGSWLLLDLSLGEAMVPRRFDRADSLATPVLDAIFQDVAWRVQPSDSEIAVLADALTHLARGRAIVADWRRATASGDNPVRVDPRAAALGATRRSVLAWSLEHDADATMNLSLSEIAGLGGAQRVAALSLDGCACATGAPAWALEEIRPYWMAGVPAAFAMDLQLRVAELLSSEHLPLQLVADVLPLAAADWLSHVDPYATDDWEALTLWPKQMTPAEIDGYVMQLLADGVLAPLDEAVP